MHCGAERLRRRHAATEFEGTGIGLSVVKFDGFDGPDQLLVRYLDCVDGTPLLDIKPYLPTTDAEPDAAMGWLAPHATRNANTGPT